MTDLFKSFTNALKHWYIPLIIGILFVIFGIYIFTVPLATYVTLSVLFGISFLVSGIIETFFSIENRKSLNGWGWYLISGMFTLAIGLLLVTKPQISAGILPFVVGFTLLFRSFEGLGAAFDLKQMRVLQWGNVAIASILGIIFSILLIANPMFTGLSIVMLTALAFISLGISSIVIAFQMKKLKNLPKRINNDLQRRIKSLQEEIEDELKTKN